jgi:hypothetical protein
MQKRRRAGRPKRAQEPGERVSVSWRLTAEFKEKLDQAAEQSGLSVAQEVERRVLWSLDPERSPEAALERVYGGQLAGILTMVARAMHVTGRACAFDVASSLDDVDRWLKRTPYAVNQAISAAVTIMEACRPPGRQEFPTEIAGAPVVGSVGTAEIRGAIFAEQILRAVKDPGSVKLYVDGVEQPNIDLDEFAGRVHVLMGDLVDQIEIPDILEIRKRALAPKDWKAGPAAE